MLLRSLSSTSNRGLVRLATGIFVALLCQNAVVACSVGVPRGPGFTVSPPVALEAFQTPASARGRDAGFSVRLGDQVLWLFGDTFPNEEVMLSATAAWSSVDTPTVLREPVDAESVPTSLYEYSSGESVFNTAHSEPPVCCKQYESCPSSEPYCRCAPDTDCASRIALWPGAAVRSDDGTAVGFYESVEVGAAPWTFDVLGVGTATVPAGSVRAQRTVNVFGEPQFVFERGEPKFLHALRVDQGGVAWVYVFGESEPNACAIDVYVGRVPLDQIEDRSAYRFWSGDEWTASLTSAGPVLADVEGGIGSVAWNAYLGLYLSGTIGLCTEGASFLLRSAKQPQGPWSAPVAIDLSPLGADAEAYAGLLHESLSSGSKLVLSFYQPLVRDQRAFGSVRLVEVQLGRER